MTSDEKNRLKCLLDEMDADYRDFGQHSPQVNRAINRISEFFDEIISLKESRIAELEAEIVDLKETNREMREELGEDIIIVDVF